MTYLLPPNLNRTHEPATVAPAKTGQAPDDNPPEAMASHERMRIRAAAFRISQVYPGIAGDILCEDLLTAEAFGYVLAKGSRLAELVTHALTAPLPADTPAAPIPAAVRRWPHATAAPTPS